MYINHIAALQLSYCTRGVPSRFETVHQELEVRKFRLRIMKLSAEPVIIALRSKRGQQPRLFPARRGNRRFLYYTNAVAEAEAEATSRVRVRAVSVLILRLGGGTDDTELKKTSAQFEQNFSPKRRLPTVRPVREG